MSNNRKNLLAFLYFILTYFVFQNAAQCATLPTDAFTKIDNWQHVLSRNTPNTLIVSDVHGTLTGGSRSERTINNQEWNSIKHNVLGFTSDNDPKSFDFGHGCVHSNGNQSFEKVSPTIKRIREIIFGRTINKINSIVVVDDNIVILRLMAIKLKKLQECSSIKLHFFQFCQSEESQKKATTENQSKGSLQKVLASSRPAQTVPVASNYSPSPTVSPSSEPYIVLTQEAKPSSTRKPSPVLKPMQQNEEASTSCWSDLFKFLTCTKKSAVHPN